MSEDWTAQSVVEDWIADRKLSRRKIAFLELEYQRGIEAVTESSSFDIAGSIYCQELDLPTGSYWIQVMADLLDHLRPTNDIWTRLNFLNEALVCHGHLEREED